MGHLSHGIGSGRGDQEEIGLSIHAAELHMLHPARDLGDHRVCAGVLQGVGVEDLARRSAHDAVDIGTPADEIADKVHDPDRGDAPGHAYHDGLTQERIADSTGDIGWHEDHGLF